MLTPSSISCLGTGIIVLLPALGNKAGVAMVDTQEHTHMHTHLIITNGHTGVKEISNLNEMKVTNCLTLLHVSCAVTVGLFNQCLNLLNLCHCQGLK